MLAARRAVFLFSSSLSCILLAGESTLVPIDPEGHPEVRIKLMEIEPNDLIPAITLKHQLIDDGREFMSVLICPEIFSYISPIEEGCYRWMNLSGVIIVLVPHRWTYVYDEAYYLDLRDSDATVIQRLGHIEYRYHDGRLVGVRNQSGEVVLQRSMSRETTAKWHLRSSIPPLTIRFGEDGSISECVHGSESMAFRYDHLHRLVAIAGTSLPWTMTTIIYRGSLMETLAIASVTYHIHWTNPKWIGNRHPYEYLRPVLDNDNIRRYLVTEGDADTLVRVFALDGRALARWKTTLAAVRSVSGPDSVPMPQVNLTAP